MILEGASVGSKWSESTQDDLKALPGSLGRMAPELS